MMESASGRYWNYIVWFLVFAINFIFRLFRIDVSSLSYDEIVSVMDTLLDFGHIKHESEWDTNPPFYYYVLWLWAKIFGISEFSVRSMSAFFSALACVVTARFIYKISGCKMSLAFVLLYMLHPAIYLYAQDARCYSLLFFLSSLSLIFFHQLLSENKPQWWILLGLVNFLLVYTHYLSSILLLIEGVFVLVFRQDKFLKLLWSGGIVLLLVIIRFTKRQFLLIFGVTTDDIKDTWIKKAVFSDLLDFYKFSYTHISLYLLLIGIGLFLLYKSDQYTKSIRQIILFSVLVSLLSPLLLFFLGTRVPVFVNRYMLFSVVFTLIVYAFVISESKGWGVLILSVLLVTESLQLKPGASKLQDFRSVASFVKQINGNPLVIVNTKDVLGLFVYYFDREMLRNLKYNDKSALYQKNVYGAGNIEDFRNIDYQDEKVILLFQSFDNSKTNADIYNLFQKEGYLMNKYSIFDGVKFVLFTKY